MSDFFIFQETNDKADDHDTDYRQNDVRLISFDFEELINPSVKKYERWETAAPEVLLGEVNSVNESALVYSAAAILCKLFTGNYPYQHKLKGDTQWNYTNLCSEVRFSEEEFPATTLQNYPGGDIILKALAKNPKSRPSIAQLWTAMAIVSQQQELQVEMLKAAVDTLRNTANRTQGHYDLVRKALENGADVNTVINGSSLIQHAIFTADKVLATLLIEFHCDLDFQNSEGETALHTAVRGNNADLLSFLLEKGANPLLTNRDNMSPAQLAMELNQPELIKILASKGGVDLKNASYLERGQLASANLYSILGKVEQQKSRSRSIAEMLSSYFFKDVAQEILEFDTHYAVVEANESFGKTFEITVNGLAIKLMVYPTTQSADLYFQEVSSSKTEMLNIRFYKKLEQILSSKEDNESKFRQIQGLFISAKSVKSKEALSSDLSSQKDACENISTMLKLTSEKPRLITSSATSHSSSDQTQRRSSSTSSTQAFFSAKPKTQDKEVNSTLSSVKATH